MKICFAAFPSSSVRFLFLSLHYLFILPLLVYSCFMNYLEGCMWKVVPFLERTQVLLSRLADLGYSWVVQPASLCSETEPVLSRICPEVGNPNVSEPSPLPPISSPFPWLGKAASFLIQYAPWISLTHRWLSCLVPVSLWWWNFFASLKFNKSYTQQCTLRNLFSSIWFFF